MGSIVPDGSDTDSNYLVAALCEGRSARPVAVGKSAKYPWTTDNRVGRLLPHRGTAQEETVSNYQPPSGWTPPGAQFQSSGGFGRTIVGTLIALVVTPVGLGLAAHAALDTRQWVILGSAANRAGS